RPNDPIAPDAALIRQRFKQAATQRSTVIPLVLEGDSSTSRERERQLGDIREGTYYAVSLFDLVLNLYAIPLNHAAFKPLRDTLHKRWEQTLAGYSGQAYRLDESAVAPQSNAEGDGQARKVLEEKRQRLQALELQAARKGDDSPPHIIIEIERLRKEIESLQQQ